MPHSVMARTTITEGVFGSLRATDIPGGQPLVGRPPPLEKVGNLL